MSLTLQRDGGDVADKAERDAMQRSHSQLPYFLSRPTQEHSVIKSGYCVKQGAVVSTCRRRLIVHFLENQVHLPSFRYAIPFLYVI